MREACGRDFGLSRYGDYLQEVEGAAILDARSVFDFLNTDSGKLPTDRRLALEFRLIQHYVKASKWTLRWVSGPQQLSDVLTKENGDTRYLFWVLANSQFQLLRDTQLESKVKKELSDVRSARQPRAPPSLARSPALSLHPLFHVLKEKALPSRAAPQKRF